MPTQTHTQAVGGPPSTETAQRPEARRTAPAGPRPKTLWEQGDRPGRVVVRGTAAILLPVVLISLLFGNRLGIFFGVAFVLVCVGAALAVRPRDFFTVGVLPPLALAVTVVIVAIFDRAAVSKADDSIVQAVVSGLAHHALALMIAYALVLAVLALRQVALRHHGALRFSRVPAPPTPGQP